MSQPHREKISLSALKIDANAKASGQSRSPWMIGTAAGVLILGAALFFWMHQNPPVAVEVASVRTFSSSSDSAVLTASGYVTARRRATVASKITGRVQEMRVEEGIRVEEGEILAKLDDREAQASYQSAKAQYDVALASISELEVNVKDAQKDLERSRVLFQEGVIDEKTLDKSTVLSAGLQSKLEVAGFQVKAAEAQMEVAEREIENCVIRSPFSGIAVSKDAEVGEIVSPMSAGGSFTRTGISTVVDMTSLEIEVDVSESYIARVSMNQEVKATLDAYPDWQMPAKVRAIIPTADRQKATVKVRIALDELDPRILPDMGVKVYFLSRDSQENKALAQAFIPREALRDSHGAKIVFVVKNGLLEKRILAVGNVTDSGVEVLSGVFPGEQLVVAGPPDLKEGQRVKVNS